MRSGTSDREVFHQVFLSEEYKFAYPFTAKTILDLGANIGLAAIYFKHHFPEALLVAVEPERSNFEILSGNLSSYTNVRLYRKGIASTSKSKLFLKDPAAEKWGFATTDLPADNSVEIEPVTMEELLKANDIEELDILKIDIEGAERDLFSFNFEYWLPRTRMIIIELHDYIIPGCSRVFFRALNEYDFSLHVRGENLFCIRNDKN